MDDGKEVRTRTFEFADNQIPVVDAAMIIGCEVAEVISLIKLGQLKAEGQRPYKVDFRSVLAYKRMMIGAAESE